MTTQEQKTLTLTEPQSEFYRYLFRPLDPSHDEWETRNAVVVGSRGLGKSFGAAVVAVSAVSELMEMPPTVLNKQVVIMAPTYQVVKSIYAPLFNDMFHLHHIAEKYNASEYFWQFPTGVVLRLFSFESAERLRGQGIHTFIGDEMSSWSPDPNKVREVWESVLYPCVTTRWSPQRAREIGAPSPGRTLVISSPKGYDFFYDLYRMKDSESNWKSWRYDYRDSPYLSKEEIERVRRSMDPMKFAREYGASFEESGNRVYYCFDRDKHVRNDLGNIEPEEQLLVGLDFNVGKMCAVICVERAGQLWIMDELQGANNTEEFARKLWNAYGKTNPIAIFPDPSGNARKSSATVGTTDFTILENRRNEYEWKFKVYAHKQAPKIVDSVGSVNKKLMNADGNIDLYVAPKCTETVKSLERTIWMENNPDSMMISKKEDIEHMTDALRYLVEYRYPSAGSRRIITSKSHTF